MSNHFKSYIQSSNLMEYFTRESSAILHGHGRPLRRGPALEQKYICELKGSYPSMYLKKEETWQKKEVHLPWGWSLWTIQGICLVWLEQNKLECTAWKTVTKITKSWITYGLRAGLWILLWVKWEAPARLWRMTWPEFFHHVGCRVIRLRSMNL